MKNIYILLTLSAFIGLFLFKDYLKTKPIKIKIQFNSMIFILVFLILFISLPMISNLLEIRLFEISDKFFRTGSLVFGGGHVVLPLLKNEILNSQLINEETFIFGYGLAQAIPGPLFTFSAFLERIGLLVLFCQPVKCLFDFFITNFGDWFVQFNF